MQNNSPKFIINPASGNKKGMKIYNYLKHSKAIYEIILSDKNQEEFKLRL